MKRLPLRPRGFTLMEMAIVLVVIALIAAGAVAAVLAAMERQNVSLTEQRMDALQKALLDYSTAKGYLPCPADPTKQESDPKFGKGDGTGGTPGNCIATNLQNDFGPPDNGNTVEGMVPTKTLGLEDTAAIDGFGFRIMYAVDQRLTAVNAMNAYAATNEGSINVKDDADNFRAGGGSGLPPAVYMLTSFGGGAGGIPAEGGTTRLGAGGTIDPDTSQACHCDANGNPITFNNTFVQKWTTSGSAGEKGDPNFKVISRFARLAEVQSVNSISGTSSTSSNSASSPGGSSGSSASSTSSTGSVASASSASSAGSASSAVSSAASASSASSAASSASSGTGSPPSLSPCPNGDSCSYNPCGCGPVSDASQCPAGYAFDSTTGDCFGSSYVDNTTGAAITACLSCGSGPGDNNPCDLFADTTDPTGVAGRMGYGTGIVGEDVLLDDSTFPGGGFGGPTDPTVNANCQNTCLNWYNQVGAWGLINWATPHNDHNENAGQPALCQCHCEGTN